MMRKLLFIISVFCLGNFFCFGQVEPIQIELSQIDSIFSARLCLYEKQGCLIDPPFELSTYFQTVDDVCPYLIDSVTQNMPSIVDYALRNKTSNAILLLNFQPVNDYIATIKHTVYSYKKKDAVNILNDFILPHDNFQLNLRDKCNNGLYKNEILKLVEELYSDGYINSNQKEQITTQFEYNYANRYADCIYTSEDRVFISIRDSIMFVSEDSDSHDRFYELTYNNKSICNAIVINGKDEEVISLPSCSVNQNNCSSIAGFLVWVITAETINNNHDRIIVKLTHEDNWDNEMMETVNGTFRKHQILGLNKNRYLSMPKSVAVQLLPHHITIYQCSDNLDIIEINDSVE